MSEKLPIAAPPAGEVADLSRLAGLKLGNYRLERLVGRGRMGAVYLARDEALLRPTAVKILSWRAGEAHGQDPVQWFLAEARLVARINHPRVIQIYGAARQGEHCYIAMEYVPGRSAGAVVDRDGPMSPEVATDVLVQAASALSAAHRSGVIHRDVKPANLLIGTGGVTKLGDFGMALGLSDQPLGNAHLRVGTPYYTAPEIWRGEAAGPASDIYSLGATYYHLLTGSPPFPGGDLATVEAGHRRAPVPDPRERVPGIPAACASLVRRAMAKSARDRHLSAQELAFEGRRVLQELAASAPHGDEPTAPPAPALPRWARALGFARTPFAAADPFAPPYLGDPFASLAAQLAARADDEATAVVALTGPDGSGRTTLSRRVAAELSGARLVLRGDLAEDASGEAFLARVGRAVGGVGACDGEGFLEEVVEHLSEERRRRRRPLVVVDGVTSPPPPLVALARAAAATRAFLLLLVGAPGLKDGLARAGVDPQAARLEELAVPPLRSEEVAAYVRSWLVAALERRAPPLLFSPDALHLLAMRSGGTPERIDRLAENALVVAAASGRRTVTSFEVWVAPERERWAPLPGAALPRRPEGWPTPEVRDALDACRRSSGMPPWPRPTDERPTARDRKRAT